MIGFALFIAVKLETAEFAEGAKRMIGFALFMAVKLETADNDEAVSSASCDSTSDQITVKKYNSVHWPLHAPAGPSLGSRERQLPVELVFVFTPRRGRL